MLAIVAFFEGLLGKNKTCADSYKLLLDILGENKSASLENSESFKNLIEAIRNV